MTTIALPRVTHARIASPLPDSLSPVNTNAGPSGDGPAVYAIAWVGDSIVMRLFRLRHRTARPREARDRRGGLFLHGLGKRGVVHLSGELLAIGRRPLQEVDEGLRLGLTLQVAQVLVDDDVGERRDRVRLSPGWFQMFTARLVSICSTA